MYRLHCLMPTTAQDRQCRSLVGQQLSLVGQQLTNRFLVTSPSAAILHTGDVRADPTFQLGLVRIPRLQEFIAPRFSARDGDSPPMRQLDRIYLDTSALYVQEVKAADYRLQVEK